LKEVAINTIIAVSKHAGVSVATVSRVLNSSDAVKPETRTRVLNSMKALGFQPSGAARALRVGKSFGVGVIVGDLGSPYFGQLIKSIEAEVRKVGMHVLVSNGDFAPETEAIAYDFQRQRRSEALIVHVDGTTNQDLIKWSLGGVPLIVMGRNVLELQGSCVYLDNHRGGFLATQHLIDCGHRQIAHVSGPLKIPFNYDSRARFQGYLQALEQSSLVFSQALCLESDFTEAGGYLATRKLLDSGSPFTAVFVSNDQMAAGVIQALYDANLTVPEDVSVIGYDDLTFARYLRPQLTTIRQPLEEMGRSAALLALKALGVYPKNVQSRFEPELIKRQSVKEL
jgi:LacI family transcriptional regulator